MPIKHVEESTSRRNKKLKSNESWRSSPKAARYQKNAQRGAQTLSSPTELSKNARHQWKQAQGLVTLNGKPDWRRVSTPQKISTELTRISFTTKALLMLLRSSRSRRSGQTDGKILEAGVKRDSIQATSHLWAHRSKGWWLVEVRIRCKHGQGTVQSGLT